MFLSSETFGDGLRHALRYVRLLSDSLSAKLQVEGDVATLIMGMSAEVPRHFPEMLAGAVIRLFSALTEGMMSVISVCSVLRWPKSADTALANSSL